jgi:molybdopterin converting factor small subunit
VVTLFFKLSPLGRVNLHLEEPDSWHNVLRRAAPDENISPDSVIAVRRGRPLRGDDKILDGDEIEVLPALSGG